MKKLTLIVSTMLTVAVCHAGDSSKPGASTTERLKACEASITTLAQTLGMQDGQIKVGTAKGILETSGSLLTRLRKVLDQHDRKTNLLEALVTTLSKEYSGLVVENVKELSEVNRRVFETKAETIKMELDRVFILKAVIKDRDKEIAKLKKQLADAQGK